MTRRTTVITPTTQTDALYELPSQPFARRVVSVSIYGYEVVQVPYVVVQPELKITDVEGNVLTAITPTFEPGQLATASPLNFFFGDIGGANYTFSARVFPFTHPVYVPGCIPPNLTIPESNLFTVTLFGSLPGDTIPNLVLVTEDADEDFMP
jgi:hypothetical protein